MISAPATCSDGIAAGMLVTVWPPRAMIQAMPPARAARNVSSMWRCASVARMFGPRSWMKGPTAGSTR